MPFILWGLPRPWRLRAGGLLGLALHRESRFRRGLQKLTTPGFVWLLWVISVIGWHDPTAYNAALRSEFVHDVEHLTFFIASMLYWWHVTGAGPHIHKQFGLIGRIIFVIGGVPPNMLTGIVIAFAREPIYTYYTAVPRLWNISVLTDQQISGIIMWIPGSMMYIIAAIILIAQLVQGEERKPALPEKEWATPDSLTAPGLKQ
jgi:cytochrome c oxidase assembly factor CtaG